MLEIEVPAVELWDERTNEFVTRDAQNLKLEHSLVSLSKWESKWCKPFLSDSERTDEEMIDYVKCMTITQNVDPETYNYLSEDNFKAIREYINAPMTATTFSNEKNSRKSREIITNEIIYYWMVTMGIPPEYQKWHLNRLLTLIKVCSIKNDKPKKQSKKDIMSRNASLNAARRKQLNSRG